MRNEEEKNIDYSRYNEDVVPTREQIMRKSGNFTFIFEIDGYRGINTGELYYSRDEALRIERIISAGRNGTESHFEMPQIILGNEALSNSVTLTGVKSYSGATL